MLRGRIGGDGAPFNVGEATVTRAAVQLASGETGFGYVLGRDREKARLVALCDALWQIEAKRQAHRRPCARAACGSSSKSAAPWRGRKPRRRGSISSLWCAARTSDDRASHMPTSPSPARPRFAR